MSVVWKDQTFEHEVTAEAFETRAAELLARLRDPVLRSLRDSEVRADSLREVVLVGGATRMPLVRKTVTRMFGRFPAHTVHPDEAVAIGAAVQAGLKSRDAALKEVVLTDVCPYSLGVDTCERTGGGGLRTGLFAPIIERNTVIPASRVESFSTVQAGQRKIEFNIYQGESRQVSDNVHLGRIEAPVPPGKPGEVTVECRFTYDVNGLLEVDVHVPKTGERRQVVIVDEEAAVDDLDKRRAALAELKQHPRDADANRAALARAARCYEDFTGERRQHVGALTAQFESVLDAQDPRAVERARQELLAGLDALEGQTWL
jgi:molecular chaperone HscC